MRIRPRTCATRSCTRLRTCLRACLLRVGCCVHAADSLVARSACALACASLLAADLLTLCFALCVFTGQNVIGRRAPSCSLLNATDTLRLLDAFNKEVVSADLKSAIER